MKQRVCIHTENGSISNRVRIAFTITPQSPSFPNPHKQVPIAHQMMEFWPGEETHQDLEWHTELAFSTCTIKDKKCCIDPEYRIVPPNHFADLTGSNKGYTWTQSKYDRDERRQRENMVTATNRTEGTRFIVLGCIKPSSNPDDESFHSFHPLVAYTVRPKGVLYVPVRLELQAYITQMKDKKNQFVSPADLKQGIFPSPPKCEDLAQGLIWKFARNPNGGQFYFEEEKALDEPSQIDELRKSLSHAEAKVDDVRGEVKGLQSAVQNLESKLGVPPTQSDGLLGEPLREPAPSSSPQPGISESEPPTVKEEPRQSSISVPNISPTPITSGGPGNLVATIWIDSATRKVTTSSYPTLKPGRSPYTS